MPLRSICFALVSAALLSSCGTKPKIYLAPSAAKVSEHSQRVSAIAEKATKTAARAEEKVVAAQAIAGQISADLDAVARLVADLEALAPVLLANPATAAIGEAVGNVLASFMAKLGEVKSSLASIQAQEKDLIETLLEAHREQKTLAQELAELKSAKTDLEKAQLVYKRDAEQLAKQATAERGFRITAEKQLVRQKLFGWVWKIGGGVVLVALVAGVVLWWTGKLALKLAV